MSKSRAFMVIQRLRVARWIISGVLVAGAGVLAYGQAQEIVGGAKIAKELVGSGADAILLAVTGMAIAGLCYVARINYQVQRDFLSHEVRANETLLKLVSSWKALVREMERRPCIAQDALREAIKEGDAES